MISLQLHAVMTACLVGHIAYRRSLLPHGDSQQLEKSINGISTAKYRQLTFPEHSQRSFTESTKHCSVRCSNE